MTSATPDASTVLSTFRPQARSLDELRLSASGTLSDSAMWGTHVPEMSFKAGIADSTLTLHAKGAFDQLNPAVLLERKALDGNVTGIVDATLRWRDLSAPITPAVFDVDGRVVLRPSLIGGVQVAGAEVEGRYAAETADIARLRVDGPDVTLDASGRLALGRAGTSDLRYLITATDITELGRIAGRSGLDGTLALDGRITGNAASLETAGTLKGNGLAYGESRVLDLDSTYAVTVADLDFRNARVRGGERGHVPGDRRCRAQSAEGKDDLRAEAAGVRHDGSAADERARRDRERDLSPRSPGAAPSEPGAEGQSLSSGSP